MILDDLTSALEAESLDDLRACLAEHDGGQYGIYVEQITESHSLDRARYYVQRLKRGIEAPRTNGTNDINLDLLHDYDDIYTDSLWVMDRRGQGEGHSASYWGNFVPQVPYQLMRRFTKPGDWVLDTFAGSGTTLIEARRLGRNSIGIELQADVATRTEQTVDSLENPHNVVSAVVCDDSTVADYEAVLDLYGVETVPLAILHPPYHDIIQFSQDPRDLSNTGSLSAFIDKMGLVAQKIYDVLSPGGHIALIISDMYQKGRWVPLAFDTMNAVLGITSWKRQELVLKSIIVKNFDQTTAKRGQGPLWRYRALHGGFYVFKHEYIFLFKKER